MCSTQSLKITYYAEIVGFSFSVFFNSVLLILISDMPRKTFGSYKYLMICFSICGIYFSCCDFWCKPYVHMSKNSFAIFNVLEETKLTQNTGVIALELYCSCYAIIISLITIHFYYRYLSVMFPVKLVRFSIRNLPFWILLVILNASMWFLLNSLVNGPSEIQDEILIPEIRQRVCLERKEYTYVGNVFFYQDFETNTRKINIIAFLSFGIIGSVMAFSLATLGYFGAKTYFHLKKISSLAVSYQEIQRQLFQTLVIQTIIPITFLYTPVTLMYLFPVFGIQFVEIGYIAPPLVALYPCLEPLVAMYCIKSFRFRILGWLTCHKYKRNVVHVSFVQTN